MPKKYHVPTRPAPPRFRRIGKYGIIDRREDCSACHNCVKRECIYDCYKDEDDRLRKIDAYVDYLYECKSCLSCVQSCTKGLLARKVNPEFEALGDGFWTPDIISRTWYQAETGKIPVSGAGYGGPFSGPGFDSMWTDMSEIVRPTRDGIHGREYISTSVDIGRKLSSLSFDETGDLQETPPPLIEIPVPVIFDTLHEIEVPESVVVASASTAQRLGIFSVIRSADLTDSLEPFAESIVPLDDEKHATDEPWLKRVRMVEIEDGEGIARRIDALKRTNPSLVVVVRVRLDRASARRVLDLTKQGIEAIHLYADRTGQEWEEAPRHITRVTREVHLALVEERIRDEVTLIASGGIGMAEHMAKEIICGADLIGIAMSIPIALECRLCGSCKKGLACPVGLERIELQYATQRLMNLIGAWRSQLLEVLGAMGIRDVRRLRGEVGRVMFFEDLERESFGPIFGRRKPETQAAITA
jgi:ferredoxin